MIRQKKMDKDKCCIGGNDVATREVKGCHREAQSYNVDIKLCCLSQSD